MRKIAIVFILLMLTGCVSKQDYEDLESKYNKLKDDYEELEGDFAAYKNTTSTVTVSDSTKIYLKGNERIEVFYTPNSDKLSIIAYWPADETDEKLYQGKVVGTATDLINLGNELEGDWTISILGKDNYSVTVSSLLIMGKNKDGSEVKDAMPDWVEEVANNEQEYSEGIEINKEWVKSLKTQISNDFK